MRLAGKTARQARPVCVAIHTAGCMMYKFACGLLALFLQLTGGLALAAQDESGYRLAVGDVLSIHVFDEPDLTFDRIPIGDAGFIQFPFVGRVVAAGRTTALIQEEITGALKPDYLVDPKVTVSIAEYRPFFVAGEVQQPGSFPFQPGLTLRQAISLAGGLTERASSSKISVVPEGGSSATRIGMDYLVKPGDTITIEESFF